jgi:YhcH/YjgK/YiaL family protein
MALFGSLSTVRAQLAASPAFQRAFAYVEECFVPGSPAFKRLQAVGIGQTERIDLGGGVFALEQAYLTKPRADGRWESHRAYVDVQVIFSGEEFMEVTDVSRLTVAEDFTPAKDLLFYHSFADSSVLRMQAGGVAVFFPVDAHLPSLAIHAATPVRKTVVKVPVV